MNIEEIIGTEKIIACADRADDQSSRLMSDILEYFNNKFSQDEKCAWNQFRNALESTDKASIRNQIFKTANLLKMKLPSSCF